MSNNPNRILYSFNAEVWRYNAHGGWYFVTVPESISSEIRGGLQWQEEGWGRMKAVVLVGGMEWKTSIWFDKKKGKYLLPLKKEVRLNAGIKSNDSIAVKLWV